MDISLEDYRSWMAHRLRGNKTRIYFSAFYKTLEKLYMKPNAYIEVCPMWIRDHMALVISQLRGAPRPDRMFSSFCEIRSHLGLACSMCMCGYFLKLIEMRQHDMRPVKEKARASTFAAEIMHKVDSGFSPDSECIPGGIRDIMLMHTEYHSDEAFPTDFHGEYTTEEHRWAMLYGYNVCTALMSDRQ